MRDASMASSSIRQDDPPRPSRLALSRSQTTLKPRTGRGESATGAAFRGTSAGSPYAPEAAHGLHCHVEAAFRSRARPGLPNADTEQKRARFHCASAAWSRPKRPRRRAGSSPARPRPITQAGVRPRARGILRSSATERFCGSPRRSTGFSLRSSAAMRAARRLPAPDLITSRPCRRAGSRRTGRRAPGRIRPL